MALSSRQKTFFCLALLALFIPSTTPALPTLSSARAPLIRLTPASDTARIVSLNC